MEIIRHKDSFMAKLRDYSISFDCNAPKSDYNFISHAHMDHLFKTNKQAILSKETKDLAKIRGFEYDELNDLPNNISLLDSGHMIGSKSLYLKEDDDSLLFTGDFSLNSRAFLNGLKVKKCNNLIIESTFGKPQFIFPNAKEEIKKAKDFVDDNYKKNYLTALLGYPLGKMQEIMHYFKDYDSLVHPAIKEYLPLLEPFGICNKESCNKKHQVLFCPPMNANNDYFSEFKKKGAMKFAVFSGWNVMPFYKKRFNADEGFTLSDHADFKGLLSAVNKSCAKNVYVHHGFSKEFRAFLKIEGINAIDL